MLSYFNLQKHYLYFADAITRLMQLQVTMEKPREIMYLKGKQTTNKVPPNIFRAFQVRKKVRLMFRRSKDSMKRKS